MQFEPSSQQEFTVFQVTPYTCWRTLFRVPWTARRSNQSILKEIIPEYPLEGLMLKLKLQFFSHLMRRTDSLEKTLMLGKIEDRRRGQQRIRRLDSIMDSMYMNLNKLQKTVKVRDAWHAAVHGVTKSLTVTEQQQEQHTQTHTHYYWFRFNFNNNRTHFFPSSSDRKTSTCNAGFDPWVGKIPGEGNDNPLWYSCLENSMDRGVWRALVHGVTKSRTQLSDYLL